MRVVIAEDESISRQLLERALTDWGHEPVSAFDGVEAWKILQSDGAPKLAILDWCMPGMDGVEICRRMGETPDPEPAYIILLTGRNAKADVVTGLRAGANDYVTKPFDRDELRARLNVGRKVVELQHILASRVRELEVALTQVRSLEGLLPICSYCKKIRDDHNYWQQVETYLLDRAGVRFSHGICPECLEREMKFLTVEPEVTK
jgi:sigma-B regulation protein RsbU (phosphoserine phosphatase)